MRTVVPQSETRGWGVQTSEPPRNTAVSPDHSDFSPGLVGGSKLAHVEALASGTLSVRENGRERANAGKVSELRKTSLHGLQRRYSLWPES